MSDSHIMCVIVLALSRLVAALHVVTCRYMSLHVVTCLRHVLQHVCLWSCLHAA